MTHLYCSKSWASIRVASQIIRRRGGTVTSALIYYDAVIPRATQEGIDARRALLFFQEECLMERERWVHNDVLDKKGEKTSYGFRARRIRTIAEARRAAEAVNVVLRAHPEWKVSPINVETVVVEEAV